MGGNAKLKPGLPTPVKESVDEDTCEAFVLGPAHASPSVIGGKNRVNFF